MRYLSPLRYPGGKANLTGLLSNVIIRNGLQGCKYYEPYAGGAGAALGLLYQNFISDIHINDADVRINAFWRSVLYDSEHFVERIRNIPLTIDEWIKQRGICNTPELFDEFDVGFAAFYMNRCNRSGVLLDAGPIGGFSQAGKWRLDARFNRNNLAERILNLSRMSNNIHVSYSDAIDFLKNNLPQGRGRRKIFVYLDPPYVKRGQKLYMNSYKTQDHKTLSQYMDKQKTLSWIMSYDDNDLIHKLYSNYKIANLPIKYSLQEKRSANEIIITPHHLSIPKSFWVDSNECLITELNAGAL